MTKRDTPAETTAAPEADAVEQARPVNGDDVPRDDDSERGPDEPYTAGHEPPSHLPNDADPADAYEQTLDVDYDEDDYDR